MPEGQTVGDMALPTIASAYGRPGGQAAGAAAAEAMADARATRDGRQCNRWRTPEWTNPPHKSHLCHGCGCIWRPCDQPTEGVATIETSGKADNWVGSGATPAVDMREAAAKVAERFGVAMKKREGEHLASARDAQSIAGREVANEYAVGYAKMASTAARIAAAIRDLPVGGGS
jgi:hypothetical protein